MAYQIGERVRLIKALYQRQLKQVLPFIMQQIEVAEKKSIV